MTFKATPLPFDPAKLRGLSNNLLESHFQNNYVGAIRRLNAIHAELDAADFATLQNFELNGVKREELIATNSMLLHELYFQSLGTSQSPVPPPLAVALSASFGSVERWKAEFVAMGRALGGGSGWVLASFSPRQGGLVNQWAADHTHALAGGVPLLALDMYEHAYHLDFGARAGDYVDAFMANVDWAAFHLRYQAAVHDAAERYAAGASDLEQALVFDVRREGAFQQAPDMVQGAQWRDPALVGEWSQELTSDQQVVVYCVAGHEMSRGTALRLRAAGLNARFLTGGIEGWKADGRPTSPKPSTEPA